MFASLSCSLPEALVLCITSIGSLSDKYSGNFDAEKVTQVQ